MQINELAKALGVSISTVQRWINIGLLKEDEMEENACSDEMDDYDEKGTLSEILKLLKQYKRELRKQVAYTRKQIAEYKLHRAANDDIKHLNSVSAIVMLKMWKIAAQWMNLSERTDSMVEMALRGCSSSYIANKMNVSPPTVQNGIKEGLKAMGELEMKADLMEKIQLLKQQNKNLEEKNGILVHNVKTLERCHGNKLKIQETTEEQKKILMTKICDTGLPSRVQRAMDTLKVRRVIDMVRINEKELRIIRNLGAKSIKDISRYLGKYNLKLGMNLYVDMETNRIQYKSPEAPMDINKDEKNP